MKTYCCKQNCIKYTSIIGNCSYCKNHFCLLHRLPEDHVCDKLQEAIENQKQVLFKKLKKETKKNNFKIC